MRAVIKETIRASLPSRPRAHTILSGPLRGARIFTSWHDYPGAILGTTERALLGWFEQHVRAGETWLDVGAHYGYTAIALSRLTGARGCVVAFEPVRSTAAALERTRQLNGLDQLTVAPLALGDSPQPLKKIPQVRGMADSTLEGARAWETISVVRLDDCWPELSGGPIDGVKIDVQGMELSVLGGMRGLLARWRPKLVIEFHRGAGRAAILELLAAAGYSVSPQPIDARESSAALADDRSYFFSASSPECEFSSTRSTTRRS